MGIPIVYFRSSSFNCDRFCPMQYYIEYTLGRKGDSNKKADKGTITHKILEICAVSKKAAQEGKEVIEDDEIGEVLTDNYDPDYLASIASRVYQYYTKLFSHHKWYDRDFKDCVSWAWKALKYKDGMFDPKNRVVVDAEPHFDFEIEEDWAKFDYTDQGLDLKGFLALKGTVDLITDLGDGVYEMIDWKGLPTYTLLPTPNGWTTMGNIRKGDIVFDKDGQPTKVIGKSKAKYKQCYKITFDDTNSVICDDEHLWSLDDGRTVIVSDLEIGDKIDIAKPINTDEAVLPIDPYVLGVWLGDGRNRNAEICSQDEEIFKNIENRGYVVGKNLEKREGFTPTRTIFKTTAALKALNLLNNKHIPEIYLRSSKKQRLELLRGLMDTDGNVNTARKQAVFTTCNRVLSDNVKELLLSLGQRVNQSHIKRTTNISNGQEIDVYPLHFRPININPFSLTKKAIKVKPNWGTGRSDKRTIRKIELLGAEYKTQCIMVDSPTNTYLCTENMIPTHNTGRRLDWATGKTKEQETLFMDSQLRLYHYAMKKMYPDVKTFLVTIFFINDGGAYTVHFTDQDLEKTEEIIRRRFEKIRDTEEPKLIRQKDPSQGWKCKKLCHAGKTTFEGTDVEAKVERRPGQYTRYGEVMSKCEQVRYMIKKHGIEWVTENYKHPEHIHGAYGSGGGKEGGHKNVLQEDEPSQSD